MSRVKSPRGRILGNITSQLDSVNLFTVGERNQELHPNIITVLHTSGETTKEQGRFSRMLEEKMLFFNNPNEVVDYILKTDIYPYRGTELTNKDMQINFLHKLTNGEIFSSYIFFDKDYYDEIDSVLLSL